MKSFNEFESTEETISIQEQRLALIEQSLQERFKGLKDAGSFLYNYGRGLITGPRGYQQARRAGMARTSTQAQAMRRGAARRSRELRGQGLGGQVAVGAAFTAGSGLAQQMFGAKGVQALQALQAFKERQDELNTMSRNLADRGSGRGKEPQGSKLGRTGIGGLIGKRDN